MSGMTQSEALLILQGIFREEFDTPDLILVPSMTARDIVGWDSHKQIEIILACEDAFGVRLKPREINALESIGEMANHLAQVARK